MKTTIFDEFLSCPELTKIALLQDDILTAAFCPPNYLATASFDGDIILWSQDREKMMRRLKKGSGSLLYAIVPVLPLLFDNSFCVDIFCLFLIFSCWVINNSFLFFWHRKAKIKKLGLLHCKRAG